MRAAELVDLLIRLDPSTPVHLDGACHVGRVARVKRYPARSDFAALIEEHGGENRGSVRLGAGWPGARWYDPEPPWVIAGHWPKPVAMADVLGPFEAEVALAALSRLSPTRGA